MPTDTKTAFQAEGNNNAAPFTLKLYRGDGMALLAMNWKGHRPPINFVGFAISYKEPGGVQFFPLKNRLSFSGTTPVDDPNWFSTVRAPIQKFRWVHFPRNAELNGRFTYRVIPVFMNELEELSYGEMQEAEIELRRETYPGLLNVTFTRGFVSSQAFVDRYQASGDISLLLPTKAIYGLSFVPTHPKAQDALKWMGFESRNAILEVLDEAIADRKSKVRVVAYDLNEPEIVSRLEKIGKRLKIIIDDDGSHGRDGSAENQAEERLRISAGSSNVKRQSMGKLQHNKTIVVEGPKAQSVVCGSTNFSWRGLYVQSNNAVILRNSKSVEVFMAAFEHYWQHDPVTPFNGTASAYWTDLLIDGIDAKVTFSPHSSSNAVLKSIAADITKKTKSSLFYSLAFLFQTPGAMKEAIESVTNDPKVFVYGISDKDAGIMLQKPDGNIAPVFASALLPKSVPDPFKSEPAGGGGTRMHHKFIVIDFDKPTARVYLGSYNFSVAADTLNGENLLLIKDRRIAVSYMIEALRLFDHYHFRVAIAEAKKKGKKLVLAKPPRNGEEAWWEEYYSDPQKIRDRELFS